ncbi:hypothetical protein CKG00_00260 [Morganella morganii]|uniref:Tse2 ADP-ribosyltransferase toxin domain-containing protein n=1 Tax=Morganella morganii TaxID=582 RepID=A0A433ZSF5_MORMO|nr:hypothetical protein [Morganella morganii]RUT65002.1 hypothetical protein CKG00_00260 [Morganella morganii]
MFQVTEYLHLFNDDLYRMGNSTSPRLTNIRPIDIDTVIEDGILYVLPNTGGISLMDSEGLKINKMGGWVWRIPKNTHLPFELKLVNDRMGHYSLEPTKKMPESEFILHLESLVSHCERYLKK